MGLKLGKKAEKAYEIMFDDEVVGLLKKDECGNFDYDKTFRDWFIEYVGPDAKIAAWEEVLIPRDSDMDKIFYNDAQKALNAVEDFLDRYVN